MVVRIRPINVSTDSPFAEDLLDRRPFLERLSTLVSRSPTPFTLALDSGWGTGKTKLLEMWAPTLEGLGLPVVYFNAWQNDYAEEPLAPLLAAIRDRFPIQREDLLKRSARVLGAIAKSAAPALIKAATAGVLDLNDSDVEEALTDAIEKAAEDQIKNFERKTAVTSELKKLLSSIAESHSGKRLVILIDELDRCRPPFALSLLERVKHVVDADGLVFVFALDREQLSHSVSAVYGESFEGEKYLGRFFDQSIRLPRPKTSEYATKVLSSRLGIATIAGKRGLPAERDVMIRLFGRTCHRLDLSLREVEQCAAKLALSILSVAPKEYLFPEAKVLLSVLAQARPREYNRLVSEPLFSDELFTKLGLDTASEEEPNERYLDALLGAPLLSVPNELHRRDSALRAELRKELEQLTSAGTPPADSARKRVQFLGELLTEPISTRSGYGIVAAVQAIAVEKNLLDVPT